MSKKDSYNATKQTFQVYGGFFKEAAQEMGMEKALALHGNQGKPLGAALAGMLREELGRKKLNFAAIETVMTKALQSWGMTPAYEKKRGILKVKHAHCPIYDGLSSVGFDHQTIEMMCHRMAALEYDEIKQAFPQLSACVKVRASAEEPCIEEFAIVK
jgi:hypothetical protein